MSRAKQTTAISERATPLRILSKRAVEEARREMARLERAATTRRRNGTTAATPAARLKQLRADIERFELLEEGELPAALGGATFGLNEIPMLLSAVRVAAKLSVAELARRLGVAPSVIAKSEAKNYQGVSVMRAAEIVAACGAAVRCLLQLHQGRGSTSDAATELLAAARKCVETGKLTLAAEHIERGTRLCKAPEHQLTRIEFLRLNVRLLHQRGETAEAYKVAKDVLALANEIDDRKVLAQAQNACGAMAKLLGRVHEARRHLESAIDLSRSAGDERTLAMAISNLATICMEAGEYETAESMFLEALSLQQKLGDAAGEVRTLSNMAIVIRALSPHRSLKVYERCIELAEKLGDAHIQATALCNLAALMAELGMIDEADARFEVALDMARKIRSDELHGLALAGRARLAHLCGDYVQARDLFNRGLDALRRAGEPRIEAQARANYAGMLAGLNRVEQATEEYRKALQVFRECEDTANLKFYALELKALERGDETYLGVRPEGLAPALRRAALERLKSHKPDRYEDLERDYPGVIAKMRRD